MDLGKVSSENIFALMEVLKPFLTEKKIGIVGVVFDCDGSAQTIGFFNDPASGLNLCQKPKTLPVDGMGDVEVTTIDVSIDINPENFHNTMGPLEVIAQGCMSAAQAMAGEIQAIDEEIGKQRMKKGAGSS